MKEISIIIGFFLVTSIVCSSEIYSTLGIKFSKVNNENGKLTVSRAILKGEEVIRIPRKSIISSQEDFEGKEDRASEKENLILRLVYDKRNGVDTPFYKWLTEAAVKFRPIYSASNKVSQYFYRSSWEDVPVSPFESYYTELKRKTESNVTLEEFSWAYSIVDSLAFEAYRSPLQSYIRPYNPNTYKDELLLVPGMEILDFSAEKNFDEASEYANEDEESNYENVEALSIVSGDISVKSSTLFETGNKFYVPLSISNHDMFYIRGKLVNSTLNFNLKISPPFSMAKSKLYWEIIPAMNKKITFNFLLKSNNLNDDLLLLAKFSSSHSE